MGCELAAQIGERCLRRVRSPRGQLFDDLLGDLDGGVEVFLRSPSARARPAATSWHSPWVTQYIDGRSSAADPWLCK
jgi:hypothetical protein